MATAFYEMHGHRHEQVLLSPVKSHYYTGRLYSEATACRGRPAVLRQSGSRVEMLGKSQRYRRDSERKQDLEVEGAVIAALAVRTGTVTYRIRRSEKR